AFCASPTVPTKCICRSSASSRSPNIRTASKPNPERKAEGMKMVVKTPAGRLVSAFGDVEKMSALYAPEIEWNLSASLPYPRPMKGRDAVLAFNRSVWEEAYFPDCTVEILDELGDDNLSAVRFVYRGKFRASGLPYENEYTLFAR